MLQNRKRVGAVLAMGMGLLVLALTACTGPTEPASTATPTAPSVKPTSAAPAPTAEPVMKVTDGLTLKLAHEVFDNVNQATITAGDPVGARFLAGLEEAGFDPTTFEVTADRTSVNLEPGSIQFATRWIDSCIIGQYGSGSDGYHSMVTKPLSTDRCLVGSTVPLGN